MLTSRECDSVIGLIDDKIRHYLKLRDDILRKMHDPTLPESCLQDRRLRVQKYNSVVASYQHIKAEVNELRDNAIFCEA